jgi:hypothetical protein
MTLAGEIFRATVNSSNGTLNTDTTMTFVSEDESGILGVYAGGTVKTGSVVARRTGDSIVEMLYHCVTVSGELRAGQARARFTSDPERGLCMQLDWQWLTGDRTSGSLRVGPRSPARQALMMSATR